jgi:hypothetical protein
MTENDKKMFAKGYRYKLVPSSGAFAPLYSKRIEQVGEVLRDYHNDLFILSTLRLPRADWELADWAKKAV